MTRIFTSQTDQQRRILSVRVVGSPVKIAVGILIALLLLFGTADVSPGGHFNPLPASAETNSGQSSTATAQQTDQYHETLFVAGPSFNVGEIVYPSGHDFDTSSGIDTCMSLNVPPGDTFTLSLEWDPLFGETFGAGDLDLYLYLDSACTESALLTSSFNSNAYTGELAEITPQVRNIGTSPAVAGIRVGKRSGRGNPGQLRLQVLTGTATFLEHGTEGPPLTGQDGAPAFEVVGPFSVAENSPSGISVGFVTATDPQSDPLTFFELEPAAGQTSFHIDPLTGEITVEDPTLLDRETTATLVYWIGVTDGAAASLTSVGIVLTGVNDNPPVALPTDVVTRPDTPIAISLLGADADIDPAQQLTVSVTGQPTNGTVGLPVAIGQTSSSILYTPAPGFVGLDTLMFTVSDGLTTSAPATVNINVTDDPTATPGPGAPTPTPAPIVTVSPVVGPTSTPPATGGGPTPVATSVFAPPPPPAEPADPGETVLPPSVPRFVRAEARDGSVLITWQRPFSDGGAPIDGYRIFNINSASSTFFPGHALEGQVRGLENGTSYLFQVRAFNSAGFGEGALVGPVTPGFGDVLQLDVKATVHPDDTVTIWWPAPEGDHLEPVAEYRLWLDGGELLETIEPNDSLIVNVGDLPSDSHLIFRVTAVDADDELIAAGQTEPVYLPPTLASAYEPLPPDAILVPLAESAQTEMQLALQAAAGGEGAVADRPVVLTVRDGEAAIFMYVDGLHRAVVLPADFLVTSDQLGISESADDELEITLEIEDGVWITGVIETLIDPTGVLFRIPQPELELTRIFPSFSTADGALESFEIAYPVSSLSPDFEIQADVPDEMPIVVKEALSDSSVRDVAGVIEVNRTGLALSEPASEHVRFSLTEAWPASQIVAGHDVLLFRINDSGETVSVPVTCEVGLQRVDCVAEIASAGAEHSYYAVAAVSDAPPPQATPVPTPLAAPSEPPAEPTPGPSLVVVEEPVTTEAASVASPQITPTPLTPEIPESGRGTSIVTWFMTGILGLVVVRGAFYAVGRFRG